MKDQLIKRFEFPKKSIINKILAKDIIAQSGELTPKEKDYLTSEIERIYILSILNEQSMNIPAFRSEQYRYEEILCLYVQLRSTTKVEQLIKLFHAIFPNPVFLMIGLPEEKLILSTCHKRLNLHDESKVVNEQIQSTDPFDLTGGEYDKLLDSTIFSKLPFTNLHKLYDWMHNNIRLSYAVGFVGTYPESTIDREQALRSLEILEDLNNEIKVLEIEQKKAIEFNQKMEWHMKIKRIELQMKKEIEVLKEIN